MRRTGILLALLASTLAACATSSQRSVEALDRDLQAHDRALAATELDAARLEQLAAGVVERYDDATRLYAEAQRSFEAAARQSEQGSAASAAAREQFEAVQHRWQQATVTMLLVAASDLMDARCGRTPTRDYRAQLRGEGANLDGLDVDHIIPKSLGGADSPWNYQLLDSSLNRSLGNREWLTKCLNVGLQCVMALAASARQALMCGL